ncbi:hypothetical protein GTP44_06230 [Duganella sp. FT50W]|uniref:Uncharacterized protein n=1 Tax=Duganella lactea TaxID=2692173 RepID=A0A6L8MI39_9BURK|nr:hypothetical protein [Duganella lactea]MYM81552.1 hypothetical protein [Duganella lactea]
MKNTSCFAMLVGSGLMYLQSANAACNVQSVAISSGKVEVAHYDVLSPEIRRLTLPNGFSLGLKIEPASPEKLQQIAKGSEGRAPTEWVKISLYDLRKSPAKELTSTWGPVNSYQGYGPAGGADRVVEIGEPGIDLKLSKPKCSS